MNSAGLGRRATGFVPAGLAAYLQPRTFAILGAGILAFVAFALLAVLSHDAADPSFNRATDAAASNLMGRPGAYFADLMLQSLGLAVLPGVAVLGVWGWRLTTRGALSQGWFRAAALAGGVMTASMALAAAGAPDSWTIGGGLGGLGGLLLLKGFSGLFSAILGGAAPILVGLLSAGGAVAMLVYAGEVSGQEWRALKGATTRAGRRAAELAAQGAVVGATLARDKIRDFRSNYRARYGSDDLDPLDIRSLGLAMDPPDGQPTYPATGQYPAMAPRPAAPVAPVEPPPVWAEPGARLADVGEVGGIDAQAMARNPYVMSALSRTAGGFQPATETADPGNDDHPCASGIEPGRASDDAWSHQTDVPRVDPNDLSSIGSREADAADDPIRREPVLAPRTESEIPSLRDTLRADRSEWGTLAGARDFLLLRALKEPEDRRPLPTDGSDDSPDRPASSPVPEPRASSDYAVSPEPEAEHHPGPPIDDRPVQSEDRPTQIGPIQIGPIQARTSRPIENRPIENRPVEDRPSASPFDLAAAEGALSGAMPPRGPVASVPAALPAHVVDGAPAGQRVFGSETPPQRSVQPSPQQVPHSALDSHARARRSEVDLLRAALQGQAAAPLERPNPVVSSEPAIARDPQADADDWAADPRSLPDILDADLASGESDSDGAYAFESDELADEDLPAYDPETFALPDIRFLTEPQPGEKKALEADEEELAAKAQKLESVLNDFGVKGEIMAVRPGPVVTLYELEPAPGTKSSRVINLADDIARSMSAVSVRIAVVPGRSVIGIELPNKEREIVRLREILQDGSYLNDSARLPLVLGKDIGGDPVIADLARMPHLLVAGTTGSGKSVAINTMILSLIYRLSPEQCRFIMVDPKMLELSVYNDIPHLLSPVVTDPNKAIVAMKWAVREMEDRYKKMSMLGVRNIDGYNARVSDAKSRGEVLLRKVQTGFDPDTGKPVYEDQPLPLDRLPYIVVVVDEMADLMMVAGKEIEGAIQRLAQMARAAGIHIIMATQRPSVDVITGTIKANFPTRISFQVTSKIDSRTILGEQGAETLLGQGDMLFMAPGGRITRVHGPFVSDGEVETVVRHLKAQGVPDYVDSVTEEESEAMDSPTAGAADGDGDDLYFKAVALVQREGKASTSFVQRHLQIGYNRAARIIEQMEANGVVSPANHVGKREVMGSR